MWTGTSQQQRKEELVTMDFLYNICYIFEKVIQYNRPVFLFFVNLTKLFESIKLRDLTNILQEKIFLPKLVDELNSNCYTKNKTRGKLTKNIGIRRWTIRALGDSRSPLLFSLVMKKIIETVKPIKGKNIIRSTVRMIRCELDIKISWHRKMWERNKRDEMGIQKPPNC